MTSAKTALKKLLRKTGFEIHRYNPLSSPTAQLVSALKQFRVDLVLDVGANRGQFGTELRGGGYPGRIVSFEPLSEAVGDLDRASAGDRDWTRHPRCALGDRNGAITINVASNSVSSSILPMLEAHRLAAPHSSYSGTETVPISTLDEVAPPYLTGAEAPLLKIDTQGFEWKVLDGAVETLPRMRGVLLELSLVPLYDGQHLWRAIIDRLEHQGLTLWSLQPGFTDLTTGRTLQMDGLFFRS